MEDDCNPNWNGRLGLNKEQLIPKRWVRETDRATGKSWDQHPVTGLQQGGAYGFRFLLSSWGQGPYVPMLPLLTNIGRFLGKGGLGFFWLESLVGFPSTFHEPTAVHLAVPAVNEVICLISGCGTLKHSGSHIRT